MFDLFKYLHAVPIIITFMQLRYWYLSINKIYPSHRYLVLNGFIGSCLCLNYTCLKRLQDSLQNNVDTYLSCCCPYGIIVIILFLLFCFWAILIFSPSFRPVASIFLYTHFFFSLCTYFFIVPFFPCFIWQVSLGVLQYSFCLGDILIFRRLLSYCV